MTKSQAEKIGKSTGKDVAQNIHNDVPYQELAKTLSKYRKRAAWKARAESTSYDEVGHYMRHHHVPEEHRAAFVRAYIAAGMKEIEENIVHDIKTGYLKEV